MGIFKRRKGPSPTKLFRINFTGIRRGSNVVTIESRLVVARNVTSARRSARRGFTRVKISSATLAGR